MNNDARINPPLLSIIIVSFNTRQMTLDCLRTLLAELTGVQAEVFVVDNASKDGSAQAVREAFPSVKTIALDTNCGFGGANNVALRQASGKYLMLLNSDAFIQPGAVSKLMDYLDNHPKVAVVGPRLLNADQSLQRSCYRFPSPMHAVFENLLLTAAFPNNSVVGDYRAWNHDAERFVDFVIGACWLMRKEAVDKIGLFDEAFFLYAEETDWAKRFHDAGWKTAFLPSARVVHLCGASGASQPGRVFNEFRMGQEKYIRKHHGLQGLIIFRISIVTGALVRMSAFSVLALLRPPRRKQAMEVVRLWARISVWTLGLRGPGIRER